MTWIDPLLIGPPHVALFAALLQWSARAAGVIVAVMIVRAVMGRRLSPPWRAALWTLVAVRLIVPWAPQSSASLFGIANWARWPIGHVETRDQHPPAQATSTNPGWIVKSGLRPSDSTDANHPDSSATVPNLINSTSGLRSPIAIAAILWLIIAVLLLGRRYIADVRLRRRTTADPSARITDPAALALLAECRAAMGVRRSVALIETPLVGGPALRGAIHPTILLPPGLIARLTRDELACVFLHELAHARRHDLWAEWAIALLSAIHWFNPMIWLAARAYRADRELARDAMAIRALAKLEAKSAREATMNAPAPFADRAGQTNPQVRTPSAGLTYGAALLRLIDASRPPRPAGALQMVTGRRALSQRIQMIAKPARSSLLFSLIPAALLVGIGCTTMTDPRATAPVPARPIEIAAEGDIVTRVYDVRDLLVHIPDYPPDDADFSLRTRRKPGNGNIMAPPEVEPKPAWPARGVESTPKPETREELVRKITALLRETIDPTSWAADVTPSDTASDGSPGAIREIYGQFIVRQTRANHDRVSILLGQLRESRGIQITAEAKFILLDPAAAARAEPALAALLSDAPAANGAPANGAAALKPQPTFLTNAQVDLILRAVQQQPGATILSAPRVTLFNGQRAYVMIASQRAYVSDLTLRRDTEGKLNYEPVIDVVESGITLDVRATASPDRRYATLTLRPQIAKLMGLKTVPFPGIPADHPAGTPKPVIQQPDLRVTEVRSTVTVPDGQTILLGGMPDTAGLTKLDDPAVQPQPNHHLYILVRPTLIIQPQDEQKSFPLLKSSTTAP